MGRGWKNSLPKARPRKTPGLTSEAEQLYGRIRRYAEECMQKEYARELFQYRVKHRTGSPNRFHYSEKVKRLQRLMVLVAQNRIILRCAERELEWMQNH